MTRETCELFTRAVMPTGKIPLGNGSGRPAKRNSDNWQPCWVRFALRNWARAGMVEWNGIFRLFRFSGILGQPREVHPKFRNEIPENVCSIRFQTRNFRNFWSNGKRPMLIKIVAMFRNLLISSFDATIRVKRAFHPAPASRGFASHVFLVTLTK